MKRRCVISMAGGIAVTAAIPARGHTATRVYRVGSVWSGRSADFKPDPATRQAQRELGWEEGRNFIAERRFTEGQEDTVPGLFADLVAKKVDLLFAIGNMQIAAAQVATKTIPIVMLYANTPVESGFVASLVQPGGNVTGITVVAPEIAGKKLQLLRDTAPKARRIHWLAATRVPGTQVDLQAGQRIAALVGMESTMLPVNDAQELVSALDRVAVDKPEALYVLISASVNATIKDARARIVEVAARQRMPAMYSGLTWVREGGLMSYASNYDEVPSRVIAIADRILRGASPADIAVEQPARFDFLINLKAARTIGLTIPQSVLLQAMEVIE